MGIGPQEGEYKVAILIQFALSVNQSCILPRATSTAYSVPLGSIRSEFRRWDAHMDVHEACIKSLRWLRVGSIATKNYGYLKAVRNDVPLEFRFQGAREPGMLLVHG